MGNIFSPMTIRVLIVYIYHLQINTILSIYLVHANYLLELIYCHRLSIPYSWLLLRKHLKVKMSF